ncbi:MAG: hypothetical protein MR362_07090 [Hallerella sp.]|uniref:hypothetical protein n=1 Tax=Hallerella sp. TaxID=2815812 RepID=UPI001566B569|nr:hypothetical protein [Hallerella sp.]MCI5601052.1 hypothetical protein [Hallerella sp.]
MTKTTIAATVLSAAIAQAGNFTAYDFGAFKMHVYNSGDVMGDASFIVEGKSELVVLEVPLFQENAKEFDAYVAKLQKPIVASITDYHEGAVKDSKLYVAEGMKSFLVGPIYGGMMKGFQKQWAGKLVILPDVSKATEVKFGETVTLAGISFRFEKGAATDFPAAGICIGGKVYLTHWAPAKEHPSALQISSMAAVDAEIAAAKSSLASGAELFVGSHGGSTTKEAVTFKIEYLNALKRLAAESKDAKELTAKIRKAYPNLAGESNLENLAAALKK